MATKRLSAQEALAKRLKAQHESKDDGAFNFETYYNIPEGFTQWSPKPTVKGEEYGFDIVPFYVGDKFPLSNGKKVQEGDMDYVLDIWIHYNVGVEKKPVVCLKKNYGLPCPVCEKCQKLVAASYVKEERAAIYKRFNPKRRVLYNVIVRGDQKEEEKGIQIFEISHYFMEKELLTRSKKPRGGGYINFPFPDKNEGKIIWFTYKDLGESDGIKKVEVSGHQFEDRDYDISQDLIDSACSLDQILKIYSYEEIAEIVSTMDNNDHVPEEEERRPSLGRRRPIGEEVNEEKEIEEENSEVCPYGGEFGKQFNEFEQCYDCDIYDNCSAKNLMLSKKNNRRRPASMGDDVPF